MAADSTRLVGRARAGVGPVELAFFVSYYGCKQGDLQALDAGVYLASLLSTATLLALRLESPRLSIILAAFFIAGGEDDSSA